ncbi:MAG TPA: CAP domain-containing protein [Solirubrobacteraceae bacterium]|nr:CAP domain-containing protein [Solirubrobacteraceae bacterium]
MRRPHRTTARRGARRARRLSLPVLTTAVLASLTLPASLAHAADCPGADLLPAIASVPTAKAATLCLLNDERAARGLVPLSTQADLEEAAQRYSQAMVQHRFFAHVSPGGQTLSDRLVGYAAPAREWTTGENLAWGEGALATPSSIVRGWMNSPSHRDNVLNGDFTEIGVGIVGGTPSGGLPAVSATYTTEFGFRTLASRAGASSRASASSTGALRTPTTSTKRLSAKQKAQISKRCHRIAKRTKASKKTRTARYDRCVRKETRAARARAARR